MSDSPLTAPTQFITATNGTRFAYRYLGKPLNSTNPIPLVLHIHFRANMDLWDPALLLPLSLERPVIIFDQAGIGRTNGVVPTTYQGWADDLLSFVDALGLTKIDLLGFSMGGIAVQYVALTRPQLIRRLILAGTTASVPGVVAYENIPFLVSPQEKAPVAEIKALTDAEGLEGGKKSLAFSFFYDNDEGRAAFDKYWSRVLQRNVQGEELRLELQPKEPTSRQWAAAAHSLTPDPEGKQSFDRLGELKMPVLVANGDRDMLIPTTRSWELYRLIENAQLIIYPKAGHGFLWQYADLFARHVNDFLNTEEFEELAKSKL